MRLYSFERQGEQRIGAEHDNQLVDLGSAAEALEREQGSAGGPQEFFAGMPDLIRAGDAGMNAARLAFQYALGRDKSNPPLKTPFAEVRLLAPIPRPGKILCSGINYLSHKEENPSAVLPESPFFFSKLPSVVIGPGAPIIHPRATQQMDYEVEFAVVIGKVMHHTPEDTVMASIAGYTILHDVSARDVQFKDNQITLGKNFDTFAPMGPCLVTADELAEPGNLRLRTFLNGKVMQDGSTRDWLFPLPKLLSALSQVMTLEPGDVVSTGTPAGVGVFRKPPVFLKPGDRVVLEIEGIGRLENPVVGPAQT
jgi:2-keto-4-pentenoate hydratase/2-oxohepta-3-ene-1,7-dioic acid hydratase in catechol pathway